MEFVFERDSIHTSYATIQADSLEEAISKLDTDDCAWDLQDVSTYSLGYKIEDEDDDYQNVYNDLLSKCGKGYYCHEDRYKRDQ